jgi:hypothetical protein
MATVMLMIAMTLTIKVLAYVGHQRRDAEHRQRAVLEAGNVMERLTAYSYEAITPELARKIALSSTTRQSLPDAELTADVAETQPGAGRSAKRVAVRLRWRGRSGEWTAPVHLTTWIERGRPAS